MEEEISTNEQQPCYPRLVLHNFLSPEECKELGFIHKSNSTVGYRPNVFSTTLSHLVATNSPHLIVPFVPIRERLKDKVEEFFGCEFELFVEFTGLISWTRGASIGWHSDDNRPYLKQRDFTAVCYLNSHGKDFKGGLFHFRDGGPETIAPVAGDVVIYTADCCNIHSVDEIIEGERLTLTLWFSRDSAYDEDAKLISLLSELSANSNNVSGFKLPRPASSNMYWFSSSLGSDEEFGFDICCGRMHVLGFDVYFSREKRPDSDFKELLLEPLQIARGIELFVHKFENILHALLAVQFYHWKAEELTKYEVKAETGTVVQLSQSQHEKLNALKHVLLKDHIAAKKVFSCQNFSDNLHDGFDWDKFSAAITGLEDYTCKLHEVLVASLAYWRTSKVIYSVTVERT